MPRTQALRRQRREEQEFKGPWAAFKTPSQKWNPKEGAFSFILSSHLKYTLVKGLILSSCWKATVTVPQIPLNCPRRYLLQVILDVHTPFNLCLCPAAHCDSHSNLWSRQSLGFFAPSPRACLQHTTQAPSSHLVAPVEFLQWPLAWHHVVSTHRNVFPPYLWTFV